MIILPHEDSRLNSTYQKNNRAIEPSWSIYRQNNGKMSVRLNLISLINICMNSHDSALLLTLYMYIFLLMHFLHMIS